MVAVPINQTVQISAISGAASEPFGLFDIAKVELSLAVDRSAGTVGQYVTFFNAAGAVLGGVRPVATPGFLTAPPQALPPAVATTLASGDDRRRRDLDGLHDDRARRLPGELGLPSPVLAAVHAAR